MQCLSVLLETLESQWDGLEILYAESWSEPWDLEPGLRDDYEIYVVEKGGGALTLGTRAYRVEEGDVFVLYSLDGNSFTPEGGEYRMALVTFRLSDRPEHNEAGRRLAQSVRACEPARGLRDRDGLLNILYRMNREKLMGAPGTAFRLKVLLAQFAMLLKDACAQGPARSRSVDDASRRTADVIARTLYDNADGDVTLARIARAVSLNPRYVCALYRRCTGKTIMGHLREIRIAKAERLLARTSLSVTRIAHETGFSSGQYFCRVFKGATGLTPGAYRALARNQT